MNTEGDLRAAYRDGDLEPVSACCGDDRMNDLNICPSCRDHTVWVLVSDDGKTEVVIE